MQSSNKKNIRTVSLVSVVRLLLSGWSDRRSVVGLHVQVFSTDRDPARIDIIRTHSTVLIRYGQAIR
jgi:hypothetical protein